MNCIIRRANLKDHGAILELLLQWFDECAVPNYPRECNYTGVWLADLIANHIVLIAEIDEKIVGTVSLKIGYLPWNNEQSMIFNDFLMTNKNYRKEGITNKLIDECKKCSEKIKQPLFIGHLSGADAELKDRYFSMKNMQYVGGYFIYNGEKTWE